MSIRRWVIAFVCVLVCMLAGVFTGLAVADTDDSIGEDQIVAESLQKLTRITTTRLLGQAVIFWKDGRAYEGVIVRMVIMIGNGQWSSRCMVGYSSTGIGPAPSYEFVSLDELEIKTQYSQMNAVIRLPPGCLIKIKEFINSPDDYR